MRVTEILMGMPITVDIIDCPSDRLIDDVFAYFRTVDRRFSLFRDDSEITAINQGRSRPEASSADMREILAIAERTRRGTGGYFEIHRPDGRVDPSAVVKGWAVRNACRIIAAAGAASYLVDAGGDIQSRGVSGDGNDWQIGIRNPFNDQEIVKAVRPLGYGIATSGTYVRGQHIYDPHRPGRPITDIVSLTVIGADVLVADLYATAAFAMGEKGIYFIEELPNVEAYVIDRNGVAMQTTGFEAFVVS